MQTLRLALWGIAARVLVVAELLLGLVAGVMLVVVVGVSLEDVGVVVVVVEGAAEVEGEAVGVGVEEDLEGILGEVSVE